MASYDEIEAAFEEALSLQDKTDPVGVATFELGDERVRCFGITLPACRAVAEMLGCSVEWKRERREAPYVTYRVAG